MTNNGSSIPKAEELRAKQNELKRIKDDASLPAERRNAAKKALLKLMVLKGELAEERMRARTEVFNLISTALAQASAPMQDNAALRLAGAANRIADAVHTNVESAISAVLDLKEEAVGVDLLGAANGAMPGPASEEQQEIVGAIAAAAEELGLSERFLGAVAFKESGLRNVKATASSAFGPFQFLQSTWDGLVEQVGEKLGIAPGDIGDVHKQALMAAISFESHKRRLAKNGQTTGPAELYLCHLLGEGAALACLRQPGLPLDQVLRELYANTKLGAGFANKIITANPFLKDDSGQPRTANSVLAVIRNSLDRCEGKYLTLKGVAPAAEPDAAPRWLQIAIGEMNKGVHEVPGEQHDDTIVAYLASTSLPPEHHADETAWCSAFVNWCITEAGLMGTNLANARSWLNFGAAVDAAQPGDICVFWREDPDSWKGHVGFFMDDDGTNIMVLGGNQTDPETGAGAVCIRPYPRSRLLGFRRPTGN